MKNKKIYSEESNSMTLFHSDSNLFLCSITYGDGENYIFYDDGHGKKHTKLSKYLEEKFKSDRKIEQRWGEKEATFLCKISNSYKQWLKNIAIVWIESGKKSTYFDIGFDVGYDDGKKTSVVEIYPNNEYGKNTIKMHMRPKAREFIDEKNETIINYDDELKKKEKKLEEQKQPLKDKKINLFSPEKKICANQEKLKENIEGYKPTFNKL